MSDLADAFAHPDPAEAVRRFVACFGRFWASDRLVLRRIRAIAALDPEVGAVIAARDERRRIGLRVLASRFASLADTPEAEGGAEAAAGFDRVDVMHTLTSFETFDSLAGPNRPPDDVIPLVTDLVMRVMTGR